jgi:hypothetical protein
MVSFKCPNCGGTKCYEYYVRLSRVEVKEFKLNGTPDSYGEPEDFPETEMPRTYVPMYAGKTFECASCETQWSTAQHMHEAGAIKATRDRKKKV